eukprot:jgi/Mesvir1/20446/Mv12341-RA.1
MTPSAASDGAAMPAGVMPGPADAIATPRDDGIPQLLSAFDRNLALVDGEECLRLLTQAASIRAPGSSQVEQRIEAYLRACSHSDALLPFAPQILALAPPQPTRLIQLIKAAGQQRQWQVAATAFEEFKLSGGVATPPVYSSLISAAGRVGELEVAKALFEQAKAARQLDVGCWNALIYACGTCGRPESALSTFASMRARRFTPTPVSFNATLGALGSTWGHMAQVRQLYEEMRAAEERARADGSAAAPGGFTLGERSYSSVLAATARCLKALQLATEARSIEDCSICELYRRGSGSQRRKSKKRGQVSVRGVATFSRCSDSWWGSARSLCDAVTVYGPEWNGNAGHMMPPMRVGVTLPVPPSLMPELTGRTAAGMAMSFKSGRQLPSMTGNPLGAPPRAPPKILHALGTVATSRSPALPQPQPPLPIERNDHLAIIRHEQATEASVLRPITAMEPGQAAPGGVCLVDDLPPRDEAIPGDHGQWRCLASPPCPDALRKCQNAGHPASVRLEKEGRRTGILRVFNAVLIIPVEFPKSLTFHRPFSWRRGIRSNGILHYTSAIVNAIYWCDRTPRTVTNPGRDLLRKQNKPISSGLVGMSWSVHSVGSRLMNVATLLTRKNLGSENSKVFNARKVTLMASSISASAALSSNFSLQCGTMQKLATPAEAAIPCRNSRLQTRLFGAKFPLAVGAPSRRGLKEFVRAGKKKDAEKKPAKTNAAVAQEEASSNVAPVVVIDNYDSFTYNICQYLGDLGCPYVVLRNDKVTVDEVRKMKPRGVLISPGPGRPEDSGISLQSVKELGPDFPLFGVCMGHQCIGQVFGGNVVRAPTGLMHGKTSKIFHDGKGIMAGLPSPFTACRYHSLVIDRKGFPDKELEVTAWTEDGTIMGVQHRKYPKIQGVQFHPESIITEHGYAMLQNFLNMLD